MFLSIVSVLFALIALYLWHVNRALSGTPEDIDALASKPFTEHELKACYERVQKEGVEYKKFLPPKTGRRYIVCGGCGFLGRWMVYHLLERGEAPEAVRIVDLRDPATLFEGDEVRGAEKFNEHEPIRQAVASVGFERADISDGASVRRAFEARWPASVARKPLTVLHCASVIPYWERANVFLPRLARVNADGAKHVVDAARKIGATVLVATSSSTVGLRRPELWLPPWRRWPRGFSQVLSDDAPNQPSRKEEFFANYPYTKWLAEKYVIDADEKTEAGGLRTGVVRPGNAIYGPGHDLATGSYLRLGGGPTWLRHVIQHYISVENVSYAHLCYERRLLDLQDPKLRNQLPDIGGQTFLVTDPNPAIRAGHIYYTLDKLSLTKVLFYDIHPMTVFPLAYLVEMYDVVQHYISLLPRLRFPLQVLQPGMFQISDVHIVIDDSRARAKPAQGGLGYNAPYDTMTYLCFQVLQWNRNVEKDRGKANGSVEAVPGDSGVAPVQVLGKATAAVPLKA